MKSYSLLVDISDAGAAGSDFILRLRQNCRRARVVVFDGKRSPSSALSEAIAQASAVNEPLVYLKFPLLISDATVAALAKSTAKDPMFGMASPRFGCEVDDLVYSLPETYGSGESSRPSFTRRALAALPPHWITPEVLTGCLFISAGLVANAPPSLSYTSMSGLLLHFLAAVRRRGFRMIVDNRVVVRTEAGEGSIHPTLREPDKSLFQKALSIHFANVSDENLGRNGSTAVDPVGDWYARHPLHRLERSVAAAYPPPGQKRRILIDSRSMMEQYNGTTVSQLGYLSGFQNFTSEWDIHVLAREAPMKIHRLRERFPKLIFQEKPEGLYSCTVFMSQPVFIDIVKDLHQSAFLVAGNMLDTITWDIILGAPSSVEKVWNFISKYFDCMFYISGFSKDQFHRRFPAHQGLSEFVTYLSFAKAENSVAGLMASAATEKYLLVFGNGYDHKDVAPTVKRLRESFPGMKIKAIGPSLENLENVDMFSSGSISEDEIQKLIVNCAVMVFPSWIEGFGMPVVNALAYGKNVVVRRLPLWQEMANQSSRLPGRLFEFHDRETLKTAVARAMDHSTQFALQFEPGRVSSEEKDWSSCAKVILDGFKQHLETANSQLWLARQQMMELIS